MCEIQARSSTSIPKPSSQIVKEAVTFLDDVHGKGYKESELKKYLVNRGLSVVQVEEAFTVQRAHVLANSQDGLDSERELARRDRRSAETDVTERGVRPGTSSPRTNWISSIFLPEKRTAGQKLIKQFLGNEEAYCRILKCLKQYHEELISLVDKKKCRLTGEDLHLIFHKIPQLCKFHEVFYGDLGKGLNIGKLFVRLFSFFKGYIAYMKDCIATINIMREHIRDKQLQENLMKIRERSLCKSDDMVDLLLVPLTRIKEYKEFLEQLYEWADESCGLDYEYLGKASRRIGRVANYIEKYKYGIYNRNEMNKIQKFLNHQCDIFAPNRRIVRRGLITQKTSGWPSRSKDFIFFLFNDILIWTNTKGVLQNMVPLRICVVFPSDSKSNPKSKFKLIVKHDKQIDLRLECENQEQRDEWCAAINRKIQEQLKACVEESTTSTHLSKINTKLWGTSSSQQESPKDDVKDEKEEGDDASPNSGHRHYQVPQDFTDQDFDGFDTMEESDVVSVVSEYDTAFYEVHNKYERVERNSTTHLMNPFRKQITSDPDNCDAKYHVSDDIKNITRKSPNRRESREVADEENQGRREHCATPQKSKRVPIVRSSKKNKEKAKRKLEGSSSYTIRLDDSF